MGSIFATYLATRLFNGYNREKGKDPTADVPLVKTVIDDGLLHDK